MVFTCLSYSSRDKCLLSPLAQWCNLKAMQVTRRGMALDDDIRSEPEGRRARLAAPERAPLEATCAAPPAGPRGSRL